MSGWAVVCAPQPVRLVARRRSRCPHCDTPMIKQCDLAHRWWWWCWKCRHAVTYHRTAVTPGTSGEGEQ